MVEVAYALPNQQHCLAVSVPVGSTIRTVIERSRIQDQCPEIDLAQNAVGVWGHLRSPDALVSDGDRVEIYRPLVADPKIARRNRAADSS